jgi:hypothetical protein
LRLASQIDSRARSTTTATFLAGHARGGAVACQATDGSETLANRAYQA